MIVEQAVLPPIVLEQQRTIDAALDLAAGWDEKATGLHQIADYTRTHGSNVVADRYAMRGHALAGMATELRTVLKMTEETRARQPKVADQQHEREIGCSSPCGSR